MIITCLELEMIKLFKTCLFDHLFSFLVGVQNEKHGWKKSCEVKSMSTHNLPLTEPCASASVFVLWVG